MTDRRFKVAGAAAVCFFLTVVFPLRMNQRGDKLPIREMVEASRRIRS